MKDEKLTNEQFVRQLAEMEPDELIKMLPPRAIQLALGMCGGSTENVKTVLILIINTMIPLFRRFMADCDAETEFRISAEEMTIIKTLGELTPGRPNFDGYLETFQPNQAFDSFGIPSGLDVTAEEPVKNPHTGEIGTRYTLSDGGILDVFEGSLPEPSA